jgi:hypothetical protein
MMFASWFCCHPELRKAPELEGPLDTAILLLGITNHKLVKTGRESVIKFLVMMVIRKGSILDTKVYRKPTHTSHIPPLLT